MILSSHSWPLALGLGKAMLVGGGLNFKISYFPGRPKSRLFCYVKSAFLTFATGFLNLRDVVPLIVFIITCPRACTGTLAYQRIDFSAVHSTGTDHTLAWASGCVFCYTRSSFCLNCLDFRQLRFSATSHGYHNENIDIRWLVWSIVRHERDNCSCVLSHVHGKKAMAICRRLCDWILKFGPLTSGPNFKSQSLDHGTKF